MHKHFDKGLNVEGLIRGVCPKLVVELGADLGQNTRLLAPLCRELEARLVVVSDGRNQSIEGAEWRQTVSYMELPHFKDGSVDVAIVDTDHNAWTVDKELTLLLKKVRKGGLVLLHDTYSFEACNGFMYRYGCAEVYPAIEMHKDRRFYGDAVRSFVGNGFKVLAEVEESNGAMALERA